MDVIAEHTGMYSLRAEKPENYSLLYKALNCHKVKIHD